MFPTGPVEPLVKTACRQGFWTLGTATLSMLARHLQIQTPQHKSAFNLLFALTTGILGCGSDEALQVMSVRLGAGHQSNVDELLELDEALDLMDSDERGACTQARTQAHQIRTEATTFKHAWCEQRARVAAESQAASSKKRGKQKALAKVEAKALPPGDFAQAEIRHLVPEGGAIWRNNGSSGGWQAAFAPFKRVSFAGTLYGQRHAAILCLQYLWEAWCVKNGKSRDDAPIIGLWTESAAGQLPPGAIVASSST